VKLTDFGLAKEIQSDELAKTEAGTTIYFAPEMVLKQGYGKEVDLWTLGVFAYEISNYSPPFTGPEIRDRQKVKRLVKLAENNRKWTNPNLSDELKNFISSLLRFDPK
jgi:calcium/calmodulin-dependent protein kinase I